MSKAARKTARTRRDTSAKAKSLTQPRKTKMKDTTGEYKGIAYESLEELAFLQWASEARKAGYIQHIERAASYLLSDAVHHNWAQQLKTKSKPMTQLLLHGHSYTPEFRITWNRCALGTFVHLFNMQCKKEALFVGHYEVGELVTIVEVKPLFDQNNMERLFKVNQKWMWEKHKVFVNLVKPQQLFKETFTPGEYRTTPSGRPRLIKWTIKTISQFLNNGK